MNPLYECPELQLAVEKTDVKVMIIGDTLNERSYYQMLKTIAPELSHHDKHTSLKNETLTHLRIVITMTDTEYKYDFLQIFHCTINICELLKLQIILCPTGHL